MMIKELLLGLIAISAMVIAYSTITEKHYRYTLHEQTKLDGWKTIEVQGRFNTMAECITNEAIANQAYNNAGYYEDADVSGKTSCRWQ